MAFWLSLFVEWILFPTFAIIFLAQKGKITRAFSMMLFIIDAPLVFLPQYLIFFNDTAGTFTEVTFKPYPTILVPFLAGLHFALIAMAGEFLLDDLDRHGFEKVRKFGRKRF